MIPSSDTRPTGDALRRRLSEIGVPLFEPTPNVPPVRGEAEWAQVVTDLLRSGDERLMAAIPCVLALADHSSARVAAQAAVAQPAATERLGFIHWLARCLVVTRGPDFQFLFGCRRSLPRLEFEPSGVPDPEERHGEIGVGAAQDLDERLTVAAEQTFDLWIRILWAQRSGRTEAASRLREMLDSVVQAGT